MPDARRFPRVARVNQVLREVVADALEEVVDDDPRLELVTVTGVECEADLRNAKVFFSSSVEGVEEGLEEQRTRLQAAIARETELKRTPRLAFVRDPGVISGQRIEEILRGLRDDE